MVLLTGPFICSAQFFNNDSKDTSWKTKFRGSEPIVNNLVHTKLEVSFDFNKSYLFGKEWVTLTPHFYPTDSLRMDAKGMEIKEVSLVTATSRKPLKFSYDNNSLNIQLDRTYTKGEKYTVYFDYISKPNELKSEGSLAITDAKGLYFINPTGEDKDLPTQIWTQGETESNSVWFVTIDKPNQKTTEEISMTVPEKYVTLSNGKLISQKKNSDGTRTDSWKMTLPHAPYLFFMGVGEYSIIKDDYKGKEVSYYVEKEYAPYARGIFGHTPEMMKFFEEKLNVPFVWDKYAQIVGRNYVSGAMENTTATLHQESAYQNSRELVDGNIWEGTIAHELFHHWFGDLVTAESWGQLTVNESFANYSEYLWDEYKYGKDAADENQWNEMQGYLGSGSAKKDLVRYYYRDKEDMFDAVSYGKGGRILHMLRNYVGDEAFFAALNKYLNDNKFKTGEADQLRLAFEAVTGKDMNWFWNQWYYGNGHPKLNIDYNYDDANGKVFVIVQQNQTNRSYFTLPILVDVYNGAVKNRYHVTIDSRIDTLIFDYTTRPTFINFDAERVLLAEKTDNKTEANYIEQWKYGGNYIARREAIDYFAKSVMPEIANGLRDKYPGIRRYTLQKIENTPYKDDASVLEIIEDIANKDHDPKTRAAAINYLTKNGDIKKYLLIFEKNINDSSYSISGAALNGIAKVNPTEGYTWAKKLSTDARGDLGSAVFKIIVSQGNEGDFDLISKSVKNTPLSQDFFEVINDYTQFLTRINDKDLIKHGIDDVISLRKKIPIFYLKHIDPTLKAILGELGKQKGKDIEEYIKQQFE